MDLSRHINMYCERSDPSFWSEPINALTNLAFVLTAIWAWRLAAKKGVMDTTLRILITLVAAIGIGSFLFHTFGNVGSLLADVIPIWTFAVFYLIVTLRLFFQCSLPCAIVSVFIYFAVVGAVLSLIPATANGEPVLNGSLHYAPALIAMLLMTAKLLLNTHPGWKIFATLSVIFTISLCFRSIDIIVCDQLFLGTHFLWHLLNSVVLALLLKALIAQKTFAYSYSERGIQDNQYR